MVISRPRGWVGGNGESEPFGFVIRSAIVIKHVVNREIQTCDGRAAAQLYSLSAHEAS